MGKIFTSTNKNTLIKKTDKATAAIYPRVSSDQQVENTSLETQMDKCKEKIEREFDGKIVGEFIDEGESAKTTSRTEFKNLLEFVAKNKDNLDYVIVYKFDRWARNTTDFAITKSYLVKHGVTLLSVLEPLSDDPTGRFLETVLAATAQLDNELKGLRVKDSMARKAQDGWPQNKVTYGYKNDKQKKITIKDPVYFEPVKTVLKRYLEGYDTAELATYLNNLGLTTKGTKKSPKRPFKSKDVWKMLTKSKFYAGYFDHKDLLDIKGKYPPMISWDEHESIQSKLYNKPIVNIMNTNDENTYILNFKITRKIPFLVCEGCSRRMRSTVSRGNGGTYPNYYCPYADCDLDKKSIAKNKLEKLISIKIRKMKPKAPLVEVFKDVVKEEWEIEYEERQRLHDQSESLIKELEQEKIDTIKMYKKELLTEDEYKKEKSRIDIELMDAKRTFNENQIDKSELEMLLAYAEYFLKNLRTIYNACGVMNKRRFLEILFPSGVTYADQKLRTNGKSLLFEVLDENESEKSEEIQMVTLPGKLSNSIIYIIEQLEALLCLRSVPLI